MGLSSWLGGRVTLVILPAEVSVIRTVISPNGPSSWIFEHSAD